MRLTVENSVAIGPDPGFVNNPGKSAFGGIVEASAKQPTGLPTVPDWAKGPADFRLRTLENYRAVDLPDLDASMLLPTGESDEFYLARFRELYGAETVLMDAAGEQVILSERIFQVNPMGLEPVWKFSKGGHGEVIPALRGLLAEPLEIWLTPQEYPNGRWRLTRRYITAWKTEDHKRIGGLAVMEVSDGVFQGVTGFLPMKRDKPRLGYTDQQRRGTLLWSKKK